LFGTLSPVTAQSAEALATVVRQHFRLPADTVVLASELECALPGCPPLETVIAFWTGDGRRHHCKVFKPLAQVRVDDLPPWWMKDALAAAPEWACDCC
jgi:nitrate reductase delta subunit